MSTKNNATLTKAVLHLRESIDAEWLQNIAIEGKAGRTGATGPQGLKGKDGKTYTPILREVDGEVFIDFATDENVVVGTINIKGADGVDGVNGIDGVDGKTYTPVLREEEGKVYLDFVEGDTTISGAVNLKGEKGEKGADGEQGADGKSAYDIAVENGYEGTEAEYTALVTSVPENAQAAETAKNEAVVALNNGCLYTPNFEGTSNGSDIAYIANGERTIYHKKLDVGNFSYTIIPSVNFDVKAYQVIVIWAWLSVVNATENDPQEIIIPNNVQFIGTPPSFAVGTECMLALMSVDQGATWIANTQWEKQDGVLV